jgi:hypothetical protein
VLNDQSTYRLAAIYDGLTLVKMIYFANNKRYHLMSDGDGSNSPMMYVKGLLGIERLRNGDPSITTRVKMLIDLYYEMRQQLLEDTTGWLY